MGPQGQKGYLDGGQYDTADGNLLLTSFRGAGECGKGGGGEWAQFLLWILSDGVMFGNHSHGLAGCKRVARMCRKGFKSLPLSVARLVLSFDSFRLVDILRLREIYPTFGPSKGS